MASKWMGIDHGKSSKKSRKSKETGRKFGKKAVEEHGLEWFENKKEPKYMGDEFIDYQRLNQVYPHIYERVFNLGLHFIFEDQDDCNLTMVREFYANWCTNRGLCNAVMVWGVNVPFTTRRMSEFLGVPHCDYRPFQDMITRPLYRDICHTLYGIESTSRWERSRNTGIHTHLHYANLNLEARVWQKIICSTLLSSKHTTEVTRDWVVLIYRLMKGLPVNAGSIIRHNMMKFRNNKWWHFCYGSIITRYLRQFNMPKERYDACPPQAPHLIYELVDVTTVHPGAPANVPTLTIAKRQAKDDS